MSRIFARPFWLHLTIWWPIQTWFFSLIRKMLHLCMRPSGAEYCTAPLVRQSTADTSTQPAVPMQCLLFIYSRVAIVQISALYTLAGLSSIRLVFSVNSSESPGFYWSSCPLTTCRECSFCPPSQTTLSLSAHTGPPVLGLKSDAWKMFRLWCAADMRARARPHLQHLSHPVLLRHNTITSGIRSWRTTILDIDISTCILKLHQMYGLLKYCLYCQQGCL